MKNLGRATLVAVGLFAALAASCKVGGQAQQYESIGADAGKLRAAFNADVGKVRVLMLAAPT
jgi:hypothetical protein